MLIWELNDVFVVLAHGRYSYWWWLYKLWKIYKSHSVISDSLQPHGLYSPWNSPSQNTGVGSCSLLQGIFPAQGSSLEIKARSPTLQANSLPSEPPGKPKNTGVGSLSLLQQIFPTQESLGAPALEVDSLPAELPGKPKWFNSTIKVSVLIIYYCTRNYPE